MKKILTDNMYLLVVIAIAVGGFALWRTYKKNAIKAEETTITAVETAE